MTRIFKHLIRIIKHKYWVAHYCFQLGLYWQGIVHDWSKFSYTEFSRSIKYWDDAISPLANEKNIHGYSETFLHHRGRNPHHYEYWVHSLDEGGVPAKMPRKYALELVCDYLAAGRTYNKDFTYGSEYNWWIKFLSSPRAIHPETKDFVTKCFRHLSAGGTFLGELKVLKERYPNSKFIIIVCHAVNDKGLINMCNNFDQVIVSNSHRDINYRPSNENLTVIDVCK